MSKALPSPQAGTGTSLALTWKIAWRFYKVKSSIRVLSFINWLTKIGIILGIAILVLTNAVINGFDKQLHTKFLNLIPQALIFTPNGQVFSQGEALESQFKRFHNVEAISPLVSKTVLMENGPQKRVIQAFAVDPQTYAQVSSLGDYVKEQGGLETLLASSLDLQSKDLLLKKAQLLTQEVAKATTSVQENSQQEDNPQEITFTDYLNTPSIILGKQLAQALGVTLGDYVRMYVFSSDNRLEQNQYFIVSGIIDSNGLFDKELALLNIYDATGLVGIKQTCSRPQLNTQGEVISAQTCQTESLTPEQIANAFQIRLQDPDNLIIRPYEGWQSQQAISYSTWGQIYPNIYNDIPMIKSLLNLGLLFVVTLAGFNVICAILIQIRDKKKSITSLQAVGLSLQQIHRIFMNYSLILAGHAVIIGLAIGILLSLGLEALSHWLLSSGVEVISASNYFIDYIPVTLKLSNMLTIALAIIAISLFTALLTSYCTNKEQINIKFLT
ncbi:FtsX-like permease family protein [Psittacicella gerlachiana]|uniref:ABC3 transporter permease C-terminal domain-containing protein n=1 Tax=Psittacicella gerlachiana TaxID=2028574 RepID=A0A3A1YMU9_9GAMM|nr:FtsX-like permease family protein [Psittacicella gerlachiana]RIY38568.1 hypothetical protein CKF59_00585 [Psittacicella gerlachiana]